MPGYQTTQAQVPIDGAESLLICSLLDRQQYADPRGEAAALGISSAAWPLFGVLWPSAFELAARMARRPMVASERILEVGCGLALASLVSHRRGADVTASDCHPLASFFLSRNVGLNGLLPLRYRHGDWQAQAGALPHGAAPAVQGRFDLIIGSDVLYERDEAGHLPDFIDRHASASAEVLIVDPNRGNRVAFNRRMRQAGFVLQETRLGTGATGTDGYRGRLLRYTKESDD
ncbi:SAM-dependent methyltransferase [Aquincola sp. S2]|uniref:SAM-dependent methyltransferase n=1 Tax=Pseudaquabacterium terrae TaxID=2732868 RepID=A0ABX2ES26_9BURK|nr:SAM-dependent methyltransferase [Aquabacterium terrae]NRF71495.1 SAM-dependent methyltransferase [Aquabacterium terrae]